MEGRWLLNGALIAIGDAYQVVESEILLVSAPGVLANDSDPDTGDVLTVSGLNTTGTQGIAYVESER